MPNKTLKALRKDQDRQQLKNQGYNVIRHRYNHYDVNVLLQLCMNQVTKHTDADISTVFSRITTQLLRFRNSTRVNDDDSKGNIIDEKSVCLSHGVPMPEPIKCPRCCHSITLPQLDDQPTNPKP